MIEKVKIIACACLFNMIIFSPSCLASGLSRDEYDLIRTAFINGYVRAIRLDIERIESLKKDQDAMKKYVLYKANQYMAEVLKLNALKPESNEK